MYSNICNEKLVEKISLEIPGKIMVAKYSEIEIKQTITFMKYVNQPVMNAEQKCIVEKVDLIIKKIWNIRKKQEKK